MEGIKSRKKNKKLSVAPAAALALTLKIVLLLVHKAQISFSRISINPANQLQK